MTRSLNIPKFHTKDFTVLVASMLPMSIWINYFLFGDEYFGSPVNFGWITLTTFLFTGSAFLTYGFVAILLRNRFPNDAETFKRLLICLAIFFLMSAVYMSLLLLAYDSFDFYGYEYREIDFLKGYITLMVINIFLTFLNEGISRFEKYSVTIKETEQLKKEYMHSQLLGLKSQMNPHFLFNSLNTLSSLIQEDADKAEDFLDHMSKVYRYLLRNNEEQLVTVETELCFIDSYYFLLKARHEDGLQLIVDVSAYVREQMIPPLTLQMLIENAMNQNSVNRLQPLQIKILSLENGLEVRNTLQPKINNAETSQEVVANINNKYKLLCGCELIIKEVDNERSVMIPLIENKQLQMV
jgi:two-component system, LytTR family, sensor kinase